MDQHGVDMSTMLLEAQVDSKLTQGPDDQGRDQIIVMIIMHGMFAGGHLALTSAAHHVHARANLPLHCIEHEKSGRTREPKWTSAD